MTRNPKVDWKTLEHEYVFDPNNISISELAAKHDIARSGVAQKMGIGKWYEKRLEYQKRVDASVVEAMGQKWAAMTVAIQEKVLRAAEATLDAYIKYIEEGVVKPDAKDAALMSQIIRTTLADIHNAAKPSALVVYGEAVEMDPAVAADMLQTAKAALRQAGVLQLEAGEDADADSRQTA